MAREPRVDRESLVRAGALVVACTFLLTASFVGLVALLSGQAPGIGSRVPLYVLGMAGTFVAVILVLEAQRVDGETVLASAGGLAFTTFLATTLSGEGIVFALRNPGVVVGSQFLFYFLAAGMIGTGLGYWAVNHWQELPVSVSGVSNTSRRPKSGRGL